MPKLSLSLPKKGKILVAAGDKIEKDFVLAEYHESEVVNIDLSKILEVSPHKVYTTLLKKPGQEVSEGEIIAQKKSLFKKKVARASISGIINSLEEKSGVLEILAKGKAKKLISPLAATVEEVKDGKTIVLDFSGESFDVKISHGNKCAKIYVLTKEENAVGLHDIQKELEHQILVGFSWPLMSIRKAFAMDCAVIGVNLEGSLDHFRKTGHLEQEALPFMVIGKDLYCELTKLDGKIGMMLGKENKLLVQKTK
ncbi:hypothetical protein HY030_03550 [Candidatus Gottesmanbacteria bacterium]|nr:hypothetical protein [Candidatus Gottesmanbacteria bacterium]